MIKRRYYKLDHGDRDAPSDPSSSSSDFEIEEPQASEDSENDEVEQLKKDAHSCSPSSGCQSEDDSANEVDLGSSGLPISDDEATTGGEKPALKSAQFFGQIGSELLEEQSTIIAAEESLPVDFPDCIVKRKSAFKCRICPRIVCLNEETLRAHIKSKGHARAEKLLKEGRLKTVLNADGKIDEEDTPALYAKILANSQGMPRKKSQRKDKVSRNKRMRYGAKKSEEHPAKRRRQ